MDHEHIRLMAHLATTSPLLLEEFCEVAGRALDLPAFEYDAENETEWGVSVKDGVEYNISRPYTEEALKDRDPSVPPGSNFGVILIFHKDGDASVLDASALVDRVGQKLATALGVTVTHHRTWLSPSKSEPKNANYVARPRDV